MLLNVEHLEWFWSNYNRNQEPYPSWTFSFDMEEIPAVLLEVLKLTGFVFAETLFLGS